MKTVLVAVVLGLAACGGSQPDPLQGDWIFQIGRNAAGFQLDEGHGALRIYDNGAGYSNADLTSTPPASQMFGAVTWTRIGHDVRLAFSCPSAVPVAGTPTVATATLTAEGTLEGTFHDPFGSWDGATFTAHR